MHGADGTGYDTTAATGTNAAVLHFTPGARVCADGEGFLLDAGARVDGYVIDVTRTYPVGASFSPEQQAIFDLVLAAEREGVALCRAGVEWHDIHCAAARTLAQGLIDLGLLRGSVDALLESKAITTFFAHGIGHMVGLGVRDVGGRAVGRDTGRRACGVAVRCDFPLEPGFVMTVEPGLYFIPALLDDAGRRERLAEFVNWEKVDAWRHVGGVRLEDNVLVTDGDPVNLTASIPMQVNGTSSSPPSHERNTASRVTNSASTPLAPRTNSIPRSGPHHMQRGRERVRHRRIACDDRHAAFELGRVAGARIEDVTDAPTGDRPETNRVGRRRHRGGAHRQPPARAVLGERVADHDPAFVGGIRHAQVAADVDHDAAIPHPS